VSDASESADLDVPPGFSWDCGNVQVDPATNDLILSLRWDGARWTGAQLKTVVVDPQTGIATRDSTFGYGRYLVDLSPPARHANPSPVFGFFFYANPHRVDKTDEIDVEVTRWSNARQGAPDVTYSAYPPNGHPIACSTGFCPWQRTEVAGSITSGIRRYLIDWSDNQVVFERIQGTPLRSVHVVAVPSTPDAIQVPGRPMPLVLNFWVDAGVTLPNPGKWTFRVRRVSARPDSRRIGTLDLTLTGLPACAAGVQSGFIDVQHLKGTVADVIFSDTSIYSLPPGTLTIRPREVTCGGSTYRPVQPSTQVLLAAAGRASATVAYAQVPPSSSWTRVADMPIARQNMHAVVAGGGRIYLIGGSPDASRVDVYDPVADSWTSGSMAPLAATNLLGGGADVLNGKIFLPFLPLGGGFNSASYELDPASFAVRQVQTHAGLSSVCGRSTAFNGELLVQGNLTSSYFFHRYDILAPSPSLGGLVPPSGHSCAPIFGIGNGRLWVGGGYADQGTLGHVPLTQVLSFDLAQVPLGTITWRVEPSLASAHLGGAGVLHNNRIVLVGGECGGGTCVNADATSLDLLGTGLGWTPFPNPGVRRRAHAAAVVGNTLYLFGGDEFDPVTNNYRGTTRAVEKITLP